MKSESGPAWPPGIAAACSSAWSPPPGPSVTFCVVASPRMPFLTAPKSCPPCKAQIKPHFAAALRGIPGKLGPSGFTQLGCSPTPRRELNPDLDVGGVSGPVWTCGLAHGAPRARRPACSVTDPHCSVGQGLAGGRWGPPWPQDPTSEAAASRCVVTSQLWAPSPPATPGPRSPKAARPRHLVAVQAEGCTWSRLKGGREQSPGLLEAFG